MNSRSYGRLLGILVFSAGLVLLAVGGASSSQAAGDHVLMAKIDEALDPIDERYLERAIRKAEKDGAELFVLRLDTPGGFISSMRNMVEALLEAEVPTAVFVSPRGAQAASAGTLVTVAANFAVMAPGTNIGAASPVTGTGDDLPETLRKKVDEDTTALIRSVSVLRGRNADALEATVLEAKAYSADEAVAIGIADFIAGDIDELLLELDGRSVTILAGEVTLATAGLDVREVSKNPLERFLDIITNPTIAVILIQLGTLGLIYEMRDPGNFGPGVFGVLGLGLGFAGLGFLPVNLAGVLLLAAAALLLFIETQLEGFGWAGIGSILAFIFGAFMLFGGLFPEPEALDDPLSVSPIAIGVLSGLAAAFVALMFWATRGGEGLPHGYVTDAEGELVGSAGRAVSDLMPTGTVRVGTQEFTATSDQHDVREGQEVRVLATYAGGVLKVIRADLYQEPIERPGPWGRVRNALAPVSLSRLIERE